MVQVDSPVSTGTEKETASFENIGSKPPLPSEIKNSPDGSRADRTEDPMVPGGPTNSQKEEDDQLMSDPPEYDPKKPGNGTIIQLVALLVAAHKTSLSCPLCSEVGSLVKNGTTHFHGKGLKSKHCGKQINGGAVTTLLDDQIGNI